MKVVRDRLELVLLGAVLLAVLLIPGGAQPGIVLLGVSGGAGLALNALGMVLVYRTNRFINFAQVQFGATAAVIFAELAQRHLLVSWLGFIYPPAATGAPGTALLMLNWVLSFLIAVVIAAFTAWATYRVLVRRFTGASRLVVTVASVGIAQLLAGAAGLVTNLFNGSSSDVGAAVANSRILSSPVAPPLNPTFTVSGVVLHAPQLANIVLTILACAGVGAYLSLSRGGAAVRGAAENPQRAQTLGIDVDAVTGRVWILAGLVSGAASCLAATTQPATEGGALSITGLASILAVAVIARFTSLSVAVVAGLVLGVVNAVFGFALSTVPNLYEALLVVIIGAALALQREPRTRSSAEQGTSWLAAREARPVPPALRNHPRVRSAAHLIEGVLLTAVALFPWVAAPSQVVTGSAVMIDAMVGLSLLVLTGWAGQISLGQFAIAGVGAFAAAWTVSSWGLNPLLAILAGGAAGGLVAVAVALPALRLRGLLLAVMTLALALAVSDVVLSNDYAGRALPSSLSRPVLFGIDLNDETTFYYFCALVLAAVLGAVMGLRRGRTARALIACRENEAAAQSLGINLFRVRLVAFAASGIIAGLGGALLAFDQRTVDPLAFTPDISVGIFLMVVVGGLGSVWGPVAGAAYLGLVQVAPIPFIASIGTGVGSVFMLMFVPGGLVQVGTTLRDSALRRIATRAGIDAPGLLPDRAAAGQALAPISPLRERGVGVYVPHRYRLRDGAEGAGNG
ncbi:MAG: ABC transporter permease [Candidatus Dormibacteria bacterium]